MWEYEHDWARYDEVDEKKSWGSTDKMRVCMEGICSLDKLREGVQGEFGTFVTSSLPHRVTLEIVGAL